MRPLGVLLILALSGGFLGAPSALRTDCIDAERLCLGSATCNASYHMLGPCIQRTSPKHTPRPECSEAKRTLDTSALRTCKCRRDMKREQQCLGIYWALHPFFTQGYLNGEESPYEDTDIEQPSSTYFSRLAPLVSDSLSGGGNPCLDVVQMCVENGQCWKHRNDYVSQCSAAGGPCDRHKCHRYLRHFFKKVPADLAKRILFCPCQEEQCAERRRQTIVPQCSFEGPTQPNCLELRQSCYMDNMCRSRLAHFQAQCQSLGRAPSACSQEHRDACLQSYTGMIGTTMTPNFISNASLDVSVWCTCEGSGNQLEECKDILHLFTSNTCLQSAIQAQMGLNKALPHTLSTAGTVLRDAHGARFMPEMKKVAEVDTGEYSELQKLSTWSPVPPSNNTAPGTTAPSLPLALLLGLLQFLPPAQL